MKRHKAGSGPRMRHNDKPGIDGAVLVTGEEEAEAKRLVIEMMGNSHDRDKLLAILNRHRELLGLRFGHVSAIALLYMTEDILEGLVQTVDTINPNVREHLRGMATEAEFKSMTEQLTGGWNNGNMMEPSTQASATSILETMANLTPQESQEAVRQLEAVLVALPDSEGSLPLRTALEAFVIGYNAGRQSTQAPQP